MLFEVSCCVFYGVSPWALLLSSLKEVSKKGATGKRMNGIRPLSMFLFERPKRNRKSRHRFDAVDADQGAEPPGPRTAEHLPGVISTGFYPAHPAGRGCRSFRSGKRNLIGPTACKEKASVYRSCCRTFHPACKVRPGADGGGMACRLSVAGVLGVRPPSRRPPVRKGGAFLGSSFGDERRMTPRLPAGNKKAKIPLRDACAAKHLWHTKPRVASSAGRHPISAGQNSAGVWHPSPPSCRSSGICPAP